MDLEDIRSKLGVKRCILLEYIDKKGYYKLCGLFADIDDDTLQIMFDHGFEFVDYIVDPYMSTLSVVLKKPTKRRVRRP